MSYVVVISGHPDSGSPTLRLAAEVGERFAARTGRTPPVIVDVSALGAGLLTAGDVSTGTALAEVQEATVLIVASPTVQGSYTGMLKVFLDQLPANALAGIVAIPIVTARAQPQADLAEALLARLLGELGADVVDFGLAATEAELNDLAVLADEYASAIAG